MKLFLELPSSSFTSTPVLPKSMAPRERRTSGEDREGDTISEYIDFYVALADTVLLQSSGGIIGQIGDSLFSTLTDGIPIIPTTGTETPPIGYYLPNDSWSCRFSGLQDTAFHLILFTDSTAMAYFRRDVDSSQRERFLYTGNDSTLWVYNDDPTSRPYSYQMIMIEPDSEVVCEVRDIATSSGDSTRYTRTEGSELQIDNHGDSTSYDLRLEIATTNLDTVFFHAGIGLDSNSSHRIVPDWRPYGDSVMILADSGMAGLFSDTMYAVNEGEVFYLCGDIDNSGGVDVADLTYLVDYLFRGGPAPAVPEAADVDGSGGIDVADLTYLVDYLFRGGPEPVCL
jgi:hypothetical protein